MATLGQVLYVYVFYKNITFGGNAEVLISKLQYCHGLWDCLVCLLFINSVWFGVKMTY